MAELTLSLVEETLRKEVRRLDKRVQVVGVNEGKKKDSFRVTLSKDGRSGAADLNKETIKAYLSQEGKGSGLRKALGKAVSRLSIAFGK
ncbi:MAG: hypothetical protein SWQ30_22545 [Thermodesulfobacteriota bacterium]|nr:hypothetical protein [Thermodesulfobacteriota bacterium]